MGAGRLLSCSQCIGGLISTNIYWCPLYEGFKHCEEVSPCLEEVYSTVGEITQIAKSLHYKEEHNGDIKKTLL